MLRYWSRLAKRRHSGTEHRQAPSTVDRTNAAAVFADTVCRYATVKRDGTLISAKDTDVPRLALVTEFRLSLIVVRGNSVPQPTVNQSPPLRPGQHSVCLPVAVCTPLHPPSHRVCVGVGGWVGCMCVCVWVCVCSDCKTDCMPIGP